MFRIVVVGWNVERYIVKCLTSIINQDCQDWTLCAVLDPSSDRTFELAQSIKDSRISFVFNDHQMFATANIIRSIDEQRPNSNDIIVTIDGDDWLSSNQSLSIVNRYYRLYPDLLVTHGSWVSYPDPNANTNNAPYSNADWDKGIRRVDWRASHLRTFKFKVWNLIDKEDLKGPDGLYARVSWDLAIMFPILEMSGRRRVRFIPDRIYTYNQESPYNDGKMRLIEQMKYADYFAAKTPYSYRNDI